MKNFSRLILASAIAMSSAAFAMESMDESALSETTGQDGVTVDITPGTLSFSTVIHDSDGWTGATSAGAIVIGNPVASGLTATSIAVGGGGAIKLDIDATGDIDSGAATTPAVRVAVSVTGTGLVIHTGDISVAKSNGLGVAVGTPTKFMNDMTISIGAGSLMNMYLGGESVTLADSGKHMIELNTSLSNGLSIANFALIDGGGSQTGGSIQASNIKMVDVTGGTNLAVDASVDVVATGLLATVNSLGTGGANIQVTGLKLGSAAATAIGNVDVIGLNLAGTTLKIYGH